MPRAIIQELCGTNMLFSRYKLLTALSVFAIVVLVGCRHYDNFTTYFNTYYNAQNLMEKSEDEFAYFDDKERVNPHVYVPDPSIYSKIETERGTPPFLKGFIITRDKLQPVKVKLDSVIIKGSKILAKHPKSKFVEGTLFLMAKTYFYKSEWLPAEIKCGELIDKYPDGQWSPDAHLLLSKTLLIQRKFYSGNIMLSRTVDIAWQLERYDILSEAFKLEAELALYQADLEAALRPYKQAIIQTDDGKYKAEWQCAMAGLLYRMGKFERAKTEFIKVRDYSPDYLATFESYLYEAACLNRLGEYEEAEEILADLDDDGKWEEWKPYIYIERMQAQRLKGDEQKMPEYERYADSAFVSNVALNCYYYERGMDYFSKNEWEESRSYFAKARTSRGPVYDASNDIYYNVNTWNMLRTEAEPNLIRVQKNEYIPDTLRPEAAATFYDLARIQEKLGEPDSAFFYYKTAVEIAPTNDTNSAKYYFNYAHVVRDKDPYVADSILEEIVNHFPLTEYSAEAGRLLGFTEAMEIDSVAELYNSGADLRKYGEYYFAIDQFLKLYDKYPEHELAPKSLYTIGWTYEYDLDDLDSAKIYYLELLSKYPASKYAEDILLSTEYKVAVESGNENDLKFKYIPKNNKGFELNKKAGEGQKVLKRPGFDPNSLKNKKGFDPQKHDPQKVIEQKRKEMMEKGKKMLKNPGSLLKDFDTDSPGDMIEFDNPFKDLKEDSTKTKDPKPEINKKK